MQPWFHPSPGISRLIEASIILSWEHSLPHQFRLEKSRGSSLNLISSLIQNTKADSECAQSFGAVNWLSGVINGHYWCMWIKSSILMTMEWSLQKSAPGLGRLIISFILPFMLISSHIDVQTYFHLDQLCGEGSKIHEIWKCSDPWDDLSHDSFLSICRNTGMFCCSSINCWLTVLQLCFALCPSSVFCRTDTYTNSECFYGSVLAFLDHPDEQAEVHALLDWWNWWVLVFYSWSLWSDALMV